MSITLRVFGAVCPTVFDLDYRLVGKLHRERFGPDDGAVLCGNGFYMSGETNNAAYVSGVNERAFMSLLGRLIEPGQVVYDIGANIGYTALWLARHFERSGGIRVVGFEPDPRTAKRAERNAALNPKLGVSIEALALGDVDGAATLHSTGVGDGAAALERSPRADLESLSVAIAKLDTYQLTAKSTPDWLVMDVEGFAGRVLAGGRETVKALRPGIAVEIHSPQERDAVTKELLPLGYTARHELKSLWGNHVIWTSAAPR